MGESPVRIFVGDLDHDIPEAAPGNPANGIRDAGAYGRLVLQDAGLALVVEAENDRHAVPVAGSYDALDPLHVRLAQAAIRLEGGIHGALVPRHPALKAERERIDADGLIVANATDEPFRASVGIEVRPVPILERGVDHADVHQQTLGIAAGMGDTPVDRPAAIADGNVRRLTSLWFSGARRCEGEREGEGCHERWHGGPHIMALHAA